MAAARFYVDSPTPAPLPFGLLSVADDRPTQGHWQQGVEYDSDNCTVTLAGASGYCITPPGTNEQQTVTVTGTPTGGTFKLTFAGETTAPIAYNTDAAGIKTALEGLGVIGTGDVIVTGAAPGPFTVEFTGNLGSKDVPAMGKDNSGLTGGTSPNISIGFPQAGSQTPKTLTSPAGTITADPFTVYLLRRCAPVGDVNAQERAMKMFNGSEGIGVEKGFWNSLIAAGSGAVDVTPAGGGTITPRVGLAVLEQYAATKYGGRPTVHVSRGVGSLLGSLTAIERHGTHMETKLGALVSAGGGYDATKGPGGASASATQAWMFVTGEVSLWRGVANVQGPFLNRNASNGILNEWLIMIERTYLTSPDCLIAACKVQIDQAA